MKVYLRRKTVAFTVRIWAEYLEQDPPALRGEVTCVGSGERFVFGSVDRLVTFIQAEATAALADAPNETPGKSPRPG